MKHVEKWGSDSPKKESFMAQDKKQNLQDVFLNSVRKTKTPLTIFLVLYHHARRSGAVI